MDDPTLPDPATPDAAPLLPNAPTGWRQLPPQSRTVFMVSGLLVALPMALMTRVFAAVFDLPIGWLAAAGVAVAGGLAGAWLGHRRYRYTRWMLDSDAFSLRKGRLFQSEIRVPLNRVQHLDLRRGPLERRYGLATLVVHTAGTRDSAVTVGGLGDADAEALRDLLARQAEHSELSLRQPAT
jgi:membrane protein YdbS with pleckstrin-like domain